MLNILAQNIQLPGPNDTSQTVQGINNPTFNQFASAGSVVSRAVGYIFAATGFILLLVLLGAGFTFLTSGGDAKKMEQAKGRLTSALIGFLVIFVAYWAVQLVGTIFGIPEIAQIFH